MRTFRRFRRDLQEIRRARRFVAAALTAHGARPTDEVLLVASELVTNAVRHGQGEVELHVEVAGAAVRIEVIDDGAVDVTAPVPHPPVEHVGGLGLHLVRTVARRWGTGRDPGGRTLVWAELNAG